MLAQYTIRSTAAKARAKRRKHDFNAATTTQKQAVGKTRIEEESQEGWTQDILVKLMQLEAASGVQER